jgi:hypothetical protein
MQRLALVLLIGGTVLLASWVMAGDPPQRKVPSEPSEPTAPIVADMNAQVDRLRERLSVETRFSTPTRDPFHFTAKVEPAAIAPPPTPEKAAAPEPPPQLIAILTDKAKDGVTRRAVFSLNGNVQIVKPGDTIDRFVVGRVDADGVELTLRGSVVPLRVTIK